MATTAMEARDNVCLLVLVKPHGEPSEFCRPEECSAWVWEDGVKPEGDRLGYCVLAGNAARPRPAKCRFRKNVS